MQQSLLNQEELDLLVSADIKLEVSLLAYHEMMMQFESAVNTVRTRLEILDKESRVMDSHSPIQSIHTRIKTLSSTLEKLKKRGYPPTLQSILENLNDVGGIRIVCDYLEDIYAVKEALLRYGDIELIEEKDYIKHPKPNGYRSLHLIVNVPVFLSEKIKKVRCEIQLRTMAMDLWASLEHSLRYKKRKNYNLSNQIDEDLKACAKSLAKTDLMMQSIASDLGVFEHSTMVMRNQNLEELKDSLETSGYSSELILFRN